LSQKTKPIPEFTEQDKTRFWNKVDSSGGPNTCWPWTGANNGGYGSFGLTRNGKVSMYTATRIAWFLENGSIPNGLHVLHVICDQPSCCNPRHLLLGTHRQNMDDMTRKGRAPRGERYGVSKLTEAQVLEIKNFELTKWGDMTQLARTYNVTPQTISLIFRNKRWAWLN
jgi:hypothetical protein